MTRRDYEALADALGRGMAEATHTHQAGLTDDAFATIADALARPLAADNPRFSLSRWITAVARAYSNRIEELDSLTPGMAA